ncbi:MAG: D-glycero-beta-D-manno-heptose 1-phosphate adenylyltransferase [Candidatus Omnitrophota bacterium]|nr:D-glycero-beta-D-manno-heptose 1-phosphate adenylyltransferase [Candidatus Omnitrophota bacterium]
MINSKTKNIIQLKRIIQRLRIQGKKIVFTNGCFDLLHYGHVKYLEEAKRLGDILVVAVNSDASVRRIKGDKRPIIPQKDRLLTIAALESVDYAVLFNEDTPLRIIKLFRPDILVKGKDWHKNNVVGASFVQGYNGKVSTIKLAKNRSTTSLIKKIAA